MRDIRVLHLHIPVQYVRCGMRYGMVSVYKDYTMQPLNPITFHYNQIDSSIKEAIHEIAEL